MIEQPEVLYFARGTGVAKDIDTLIDGDDDNVFLIGKILALVKQNVGTRNSESSTMNSEQHCLWSLACCSFGPDIESQAVLTLRIPHLIDKVHVHALV